MRKSIWITSLLCVLATGQVVAQPTDDAMREYEQAMELTPNLENGKKVYRICSVCHTPEGWGLESGAYPQVAGQLPTY